MPGWSSADHAIASHVDGMYTQALFGANSLALNFSSASPYGWAKKLSIPIVRVAEAKMWQKIDSGIYCIGSGLNSVGENISQSNIWGSKIIGDFVSGAGDIVIKGTNLLGDAVGSLYEFQNDLHQPNKKLNSIITRGIWDLGEFLWRKITEDE